MMTREEVEQKAAAKKILRNPETKPLTSALKLELETYAQAGKYWVKPGETFDVLTYLENYVFRASACGCMGPQGFMYCNCQMAYLLEEYKFEIMLEMMNHA